MATSLTIIASAYSIQTAKAGTQYGQLAAIPMRNGQAGALWRVALDKIPRNATVTRAVIRWSFNEPHTGSWTLSHYRCTGKWPSQVTWSKRPTLSAKIASKTTTAPKAGTVVDVDITATIQQMVAGTLANNGWYTSIDQSGTTKMRGTTASGGRPALYITYTVPPPTPSNLEPSAAAVSTAKPTLLFDADPAITALQVQIDPTASTTAPVWDSGTVVATGGILDLDETTYPGLAPNTVSYWRARQQTEGGWSPWSSYVSFTHTSRADLTITNPTGAPNAQGQVPVGDGTPVLAWTFAGTQTAWRARLLADNGDPIADSGRHAGTDTDWTPPKGLTRDGQTGTFELEVWDDTERAATPGDPAQTIVTLEVVLEPDLATEPFAETTATVDWFEPLVTITGHRSQLPDAVILTRDGAEVSRWTSDQLLDTGQAVQNTDTTWQVTVTDPAAVMGRQQEWHLVPVVNNARGAAGPAALAVPTSEGIWLTSTEAPNERICLFGSDDQPQEQPEIAVVHTPIGETLSPPVVRRRLQRTLPQGAITGRLIDHPHHTNQTGRAAEARLRAWVDDDAGATFWLHLGGATHRVCIGDATFTELNLRLPGQPTGRVLGVAFNWWTQ